MPKIYEIHEIPTTCYSDVLDGFTNLDKDIRPIHANTHLIGRAFTVNMPAGDNLVVLDAISKAKPGDVLVIDTKGNRDRAIAGDFIVGLAKTLGIAGIVTDGTIRDIEGIRALNYPVFCLGTTIAASHKRGFGELNVSISCGGATISPGDLIVGDEDGVVVIPREREQEVISEASNKLSKDIERDKKNLWKRARSS